MPRAFETAVQPRHVQHRSNRLEAANIAVSNMVLIRCSLRTKCETLLSVIFITIYSVLEHGKSETDINLDLPPVSYKAMIFHDELVFL